MTLPEISQFAVSAAALACMPLQSLVAALAEVPYACVPLSSNTAMAVALSFALSYLLWRIWPQPDRVAAKRLLCGFAAFVLIWCAALSVNTAFRHELVALDVGQGDSFLVRSSGSALLVDVGANDAMLREALARNGVCRLDAVLITHGDDDHCGSLEALASVVNIERVLLSEGVRDCPCLSCSSLLARADGLRGDPEIVFLRAGDAFSCGLFSFQVVWPRFFSDEGGNADSVCLFGFFPSSSAGDDAYDAWRILLAGDLESEQLLEIGKMHDVADIDVFKVGHHGSRAALEERSADLLSPAISLIGVGDRNRYGHPSEEVVGLLEREGSAVFRTDLHGDVKLHFGDDEIRVSASKVQ